MEGINIGDAFELFAIFLDHVSDEWLDVLLLDKLEEFKTGRVEQVVAWHCFIDDVEDQSECVVVCHESLVEGILKTDQGAEEFEGNFIKISTMVQV